jgi:uncharacterized protein YeaO (DUF488 family)
LIHLVRAYDATVVSSPGPRFLVERLWPRGVRKSALRLDGWLKEVAPSTDLRKWFGHDPARWVEFRVRYIRELEAHPSAWSALLEVAQRGDVTLVFSSHDMEHNNAVALRDYLESKMHQGGSRSKTRKRVA